MANEQNLKPIKPLSHDEAVKQGKKGGKASGKARRERKEKLILSLMLLGLIEKNDVDYKESIKEIIKKGGSNILTLSKMIMDATEGTKTALTNADGSEIFPRRIEISFKKPDDKSKSKS